MTFVPPSSFASGSVTVAGTVDVGDRVGRLLGHVTVDNVSLAVTGPQTDAEFAARLPFAVTGPLTDAQLAARLPLSVTGPLTDAQLAARLPLGVTGPLTDAELRASAVPVDGSAVTQPVSADSLPLPDGAATDETLSDVALTAILQRDKLAVE